MIHHSILSRPTRERIVRKAVNAQVLRREWLLFGLVVWYRTIDREEIPAHVPLVKACFGDTGGWVSKFAPFDERGVRQGNNPVRDGASRSL